MVPVMVGGHSSAAPQHASHGAGLLGRAGFAPVSPAGTGD